ncbi:MAG: hypothetical protein K9K37_03430 [Desulfocapsa sp.]|nr:hypothetical protein [Desulfocapsa sp.]
MKRYFMLLLTLLLWLPSSLCFGWGNGHRIISTGAFSVLPQWEQNIWNRTALDPVLGGTPVISENLQIYYSKYPDFFSGQGYDCTTRNNMGQFIYGEVNGVYSLPAPDCESTPQPNIYHLFDWDSPANRDALYRGAKWYFDSAVAAFQNNDPMAAAQLLGSFVHAIEDQTYPFRALEGIEGEESRNSYVPDSEPGEANYLFWRFNDSTVLADIPGYTPSLLGNTTEAAAQECTDKIVAANAFTRSLMQDFVDAHLLDEYLSQVTGPETLIITSSMARNAAKLVADVFHTAFYLAYELDPEYQSVTTGTVTTSGSAPAETVDVLQSSGTAYTLSATGGLDGTLSLMVEHQVNINSGAYSGWKWRKCSYELNGYSGTFYSIFDNNGNAKGYINGDIHAVSRKVGNTRIWYLISIDGIQTSGTISLALNSTDVSGHIENTYPPITELFISTGLEWNDTYAGAINGDISVGVTTINVPAVGVEYGFGIGTDIPATGSGWAYRDKIGYPTEIIYKSLDGENFGSQTFRINSSVSPMTRTSRHELVLERGHAPQGNNIVGVIPMRDGNRLHLTFDQMNDEIGVLEAQPAASSPSLPTGYGLVGSVYDVSTSADYSGNVEVCLGYTGSVGTPQLLQYLSSTWQLLDSTVDAGNSHVCGTATSLSTFAIGDVDT